MGDESVAESSEIEKAIPVREVAVEDVADLHEVVVDGSKPRKRGRSTSRSPVRDRKASKRLTSRSPDRSRSSSPSSSGGRRKSARSSSGDTSPLHERLHRQWTSAALRRVGAFKPDR